jgi:hypothetical protein
MGKLTERAGAAWDWWDRLKEIAEALGISGWIRTAAVLVLGAVWTGLVWFFNRLPFGADAGLGLLLAIGCTHLYVALRRAWSLRGLKTVDFKELGTECLSFQNDVFEFLATRQESAPLRENIPAGTPEEISKAMHDSWARGVQRSNQFRIRISQKFAHRAVAINAQLQNLGIKPGDMWAFDYQIGGMAAYFGAIGKLLEAGLLAEARQINSAEIQRLYISVS